MTTIQIYFIITFAPMLWMIFVILLDGYFNGDLSEM
jgi:hypothetical protein